MRRRISCSRAASKYCWGVKYGMAFLGAKIRWMVGGCQAQNGRLYFFGGGIEAIDAIEAIEAIDAIEDIEDMGFGGCGLGGMEKNKKSASPKKNSPAAKNDASCVSRVAWPYLWILATTDPPRLFLLAMAGSKRRNSLSPMTKITVLRRA